MGDSISQISKNRNIAAIELATDDSDDSDSTTAADGSKLNSFSANLRADRDASTGETDSKKAYDQRVHEMNNDGIVPVASRSYELSARASVSTGDQQASSEAVEGLPTLKLQDLNPYQKV